MKLPHKCKCNTCAHCAEFISKLEFIPPAQRGWVEALYDELQQTMQLRDYFKAIVQNEWPSSEEILALYRKSLKSPTLN
jgi:hypothetical protein